MIKKSPKDKRAVIMSDEYITESGIQGGKALGDHIAVFSLIIGIPFLIVGIYGFLNILFGWGFPTNLAIIILVLLVLIIGFLMTLGGITIYKTKHDNKKDAG